MRRTISVATILASAILGLAAVPWPSTRAFADGALVVGMPGNDPSNGFRYATNSVKSTEDARADAIAQCRKSKYPNTGKACKLIEIFTDECAAVAFNGDADTPSTAVGWSIAANSRSAKREALEKCDQMRKGKGRECHIDGEATCDGSAQ